jgi:hypothetical protein
VANERGMAYAVPGGITQSWQPNVSAYGDGMAKRTSLATLADLDETQKKALTWAAVALAGGLILGWWLSRR